MTTKDAVNELLTSVRTRLQDGLGVATPSDELVLQAAKELNLVVGKRGRDGGTFPTDTGLTQLGLDITSFRANQATERELVKAERAKKKAEQGAAVVDTTETENE